MTTREYIVDADGHVCEPADLWEREPPGVDLRDRGIRLRWNEATGFDECLVEDRMATDRGLVGLGNAGETLRGLRPGPPLRGPATRPASTPHERVKVLDSEGIDLSVMYPGLGLKLGGITGPASSRCSRARSTTTGSPSGARSRPTGSRASARSRCRTPTKPRARCTGSATAGSSAASAGPNAYNDRPFHHPSYTPVWEALEETGLPLGLHIAGLADMPGASRGHACTSWRRARTTR